MVIISLSNSYYTAHKVYNPMSTLTKKFLMQKSKINTIKASVTRAVKSCLIVFPNIQIW